MSGKLGVKPGAAGVVITNVNPIGPAADAALQAGDIIAEINHPTIRSEADIGQALAKASGRPSLLLVNRGGQSFFLTVNVG